MTNYLNDQREILTEPQATVKLEPRDDVVAEDKYFVSIGDSLFKYEAEDRENNELLIKEEVTSNDEQNACVKYEEDVNDINSIHIKSEEFFIKEESTCGEIDDFQCLICDETCTEKSILLLHILDHGKRFHCDICQKSFPRNSKYTTTDQSHKCIRPEYRPHVCEICHKRYTEKCNLDRHKHTHAQRSEFSCDHCPKRFRSKGNLWNHIHYHKVKSVKPYLCDMCHKRYHQLCHLERHKLTHTGEKPFRCEICHKRFGDNTNLTNHRRCHANERPYVCNICHKRFKTSSNLINHNKIHTNERPYTCSICDKTFRKNSNLTSHRKVHRLNAEIDEFDVNTKNPKKRHRL